MLTQASTPVRSEAAMRGACDGVFIHAYLRGEEPGDKIVILRRGRARYDDAPHRNFCKESEIGIHPADSSLLIDFYQVVETVFPHVFEANPQRLGKTRWRWSFSFRLCGEI